MKLERRDFEEVVDRLGYLEDLHTLHISAGDVFTPEPHALLVFREGLTKFGRAELDLQAHLTGLQLVHRGRHSGMR